MERYLCIHCHFYQPPRENPWLEAVEVQDSAYPYHDWNERITAECYAPNAASRVLDAQGRILKIANNYSKISFNFGPTLLSWMEEKTPEVYAAILQADRESQASFSGHGSALAQAYNHTILPLANRADKYTQILWGIRDFDHRFGRSPEGMWLPEAAVDTESLDILSDLGIRFVVLAPRQAGKVRKLGGRAWKDVSGGRIDPTRAYQARLPSRRTIALFFYDGPISQAVAFENQLNNGEHFAQRLMGGFSDQRPWAQLLHIATDGETYGHHHRHGDMALAYALHHIESNNLAKVTNYGEYLEKHPPEAEAQVVENSSWSCSHGVERWRANCGCATRSDWNQEWRAPLRGALDWLRDQLAPRYQEQARGLLKDPWAARDDYLDLVLDRGGPSRFRFFERHATRQLSDYEVVTALKLLEMQRHAMLMYTSCGWFFDELSGIETVQVIMYAGRAVQLGQELFGDHLEDGFLERLGHARSNLPERGTGADIYRRCVKPAALDLLKVGAHYAISSLFERYADRQGVYCYEVSRHDHRFLESGRAKLVVGHGEICSRVTQQKAELSYAAVHLGDHNLSAGVRGFRGDDQYERLVEEAMQAFQRADLPETIRILDRHFDGITYSLPSLFRDEQRKIINLILDNTLAEAEAGFRQIYEHHGPLVRFLGEMGAPLPKVFNITGEFVLNRSLWDELANVQPDPVRIRALLEAARRDRIALDHAGLSFAFKNTLERLINRLREQPDSLERLRELASAMDLVRSLPFAVDLWRVQNVYYDLAQNARLAMLARDDEEARRWLGLFDGLADRLSIHIPEPVAETQVA